MRSLNRGPVKSGSYVVGPQGGLYQIVKVDDKTITRLLLNDVHGNLGVPLPAFGRERVTVSNPHQLTQGDLQALFGPRFGNYQLCESFADLESVASKL